MEKIQMGGLTLRNKKLAGPGIAPPRIGHSQNAWRSKPQGFVKFVVNGTDKLLVVIVCAPVNLIQQPRLRDETAYNTMKNHIIVKFVVISC